MQVFKLVKQPERRNKQQTRTQGHTLRDEGFMDSMKAYKLHDVENLKMTHATVMMNKFFNDLPLPDTIDDDDDDTRPAPISSSNEHSVLLPPSSNLPSTQSATQSTPPTTHHADPRSTVTHKQHDRTITNKHHVSTNVHKHRNCTDTAPCTTSRHATTKQRQPS
ncbi:hypothetical protein H310_15266 [Aphanomyces invadans]|uniref:Uncharacterized protein n=1 Tax=Aphanomyces invadans TaxID=157072 RepID=A0A024T9B8_9STRA|nr:hypothetical protein H310_15266 [Aphanomyces invadans]ETV89892.1 hypothetical protein H310_15266 [Aphanomyces invadans]|eukprot:XP_008881476.1 hypothetical protein H310_15266 [Aphanomyces invadans]